jgi:hemolysin III
MMSREEAEEPGPSRALELLVDRQVHRAGLAAAGLAGSWLIAVAATSGRTSVVVSVLIYAGGLLAMLGCSAAYNHSANASPRREWLRRLDHAAIALMIAGTYTPFTVIKLTGTWSTAMTAGIWTIAGAGIAIKLLESRRLERVSVVFYLALGWMGLIALHPLARALDPETLVLLGVGGILYTLGVIFHLWRSLPFQTAVWHGFVLLAAGCHYAAVLHTL